MIELQPFVAENSTGEMNVNRVNLGGGSTPSFWKSPKWRLTDVIVLVVTIIVGYPLYYQEPFQRQFYINDLTISHPFAKTQRVNNKMLSVYSIIVPLVSIVLIVAILGDPRHRWYLLYASVLGLFLSVSLTNVFTDFIKNWIGRLRPDFLARCKPRPGLPIDTLLNASEVCTTKNVSRLLDGFRTTPSGHSSQSFAGLGYLYLWLCGQLLTEFPQSGIWRKLVSLVPLVGALVIALSRTQDYRHHFIDVILGSALGYVIASYTYRRFFPSIDSPLPFKPLFDDSDVTLDDYKGHSENAELDPLTA